jgi:acyl carrier protein
MTAQFDATAVRDPEFEQALLTLVAEQIDAEEALTRETRIDELDIDSLDLIEIAQTVDDEFNIRVDARDVVGAETVGDLLDAVAKGGSR